MRTLQKGVCFNEYYDKSLNLETGPVAYAVRHNDMNQIETCRSGIAFIAFSDWVLEQGGVVYGVGYKDLFRVAHKRATTKEQLDDKYMLIDSCGICYFANILRLSDLAIGYFWG